MERKKSYSDHFYVNSVELTFFLKDKLMGRGETSNEKKVLIILMTYEI